MIVGDRQKAHTRAPACVRVLMEAGGGGDAQVPVAYRDGCVGTVGWGASRVIVEARDKHAGTCVGAVGWGASGLGGCQPVLERWAPSFRAMNLQPFA